MANLLIDFRREAGDFAQSSGRERVDSEVLQVIGTEPGELSYNLSFGTPLRDLVGYDSAEEVRGIAAFRVQQAFSKWLRYIRLLNVDVTIVSGAEQRDGLRVLVTYEEPVSLRPRVVSREI